MASRRRYRSESASASSPAVDPGGGAGDMPPPPPQADDDALVRAAEATRHAEELSRQHHARQQLGLPEPHIDPEQRQAIEAHIDTMEGLSDHKRRFLKSHPSLLTEPYVSLMKHAVMVARHAGVPEDTDHFDRAVLAGIAKDIQHYHALSQLTAASARPTPENAQAHHEIGTAADDLQREAETHHAAFIAENPPPPPPAPRRSIPMSAPVSRDAPMPSGQRFSDSTKIHLSADEREIANSSYKHLPTKEERELAYARNKRKMLQMKADGGIQGDR